MEQGNQILDLTLEINLYGYRREVRCFLLSRCVLLGGNSLDLDLGRLGILFEISGQTAGRYRGLWWLLGLILILIFVLLVPFIFGLVPVRRRAFAFFLFGIVLCDGVSRFLRHLRGRWECGLVFRRVGGRIAGLIYLAFGF